MKWQFLSLVEIQTGIAYLELLELLLQLIIQLSLLSHTCSKVIDTPKIKCMSVYPSQIAM
ncbi:hypothetical protein HYC85_005781 [Camellia sinensis]|uniref:Uncharacterized protein n=1 Tax=Camellia sinensis TaxID=4442 RepID=A0A7J7I281_CAMSI|nr:hypothetical protein HYC85_005781 [Camellia sinensis]